MECKCYADIAANGKPIILKCPLCKEAPRLYEACKEALEVSHNPKVERILMKAIAKVEG